VLALIASYPRGKLGYRLKKILAVQQRGIDVEKCLKDNHRGVGVDDGKIIEPEGWHGAGGPPPAERC